MPRTVRNPKLDTRSARAKLRARKSVYWTPISPGCALGYRKGAKGGAWVAKFTGGGQRNEMTIGPTDDVMDADGVAAMSFAQAQERARTWFGEVAREAAGEESAGPYTVYIQWFQDEGFKSVSEKRYMADAFVLPELGDVEVARLRARSIRNWHRSIAAAPPRVRTRPGDNQKFRDGTTHLAYKPEHAVDLDTGAVVAAELHPADEGDTTTLSKTLAKAEANLEAVDAAPTSENPAECIADKGYHSRAVLRALNDSPWKTRIAAPKQTGFSRWHGDEAARRAVTNNRARLKSGVAREAFKLRAEIVERCFAHNLDRGGMRRTWLRGRENVHKRYLLHVAGHNLSLLMRQLIGAGTPREAVAGGYGGIFVLLTPTGAMLVARRVSQSGQTAFAAAFLIWE